MPDWLRRAGHGTADDGALVTWSVAEGRRGRRWREVVRTGEGIRSSLLLELDPQGRFSHLELSTAAGLLTLHPEGDGTLHGNTVTGRGVEHIEGLPWDQDTVILVEGSAVCRAAPANDGRRRSVLRIGLDLRFDQGPVPEFLAEADEQRLPVLGGSENWPLEMED